MTSRTQAETACEGWKRTGAPPIPQKTSQREGFVEALENHSMPIKRSTREIVP